MKVLAVLNYQKCVVLEVPEVIEPDTDEGRKPDWQARERIAQLAEQNSQNVELEWTYSDYFKEVTVKTHENDKGGWQVNGVEFESVEWFDL